MTKCFFFSRFLRNSQVLVFINALFILLSGCASKIEHTFKVDKSLLNYSQRKPVKHEGYYDSLTGTGKWINYLVLDLPHSPIKKLRKEIEVVTKLDLSKIVKTRQMESHLTLISPTEYRKLHPFLKISYLNRKYLPQVQKLSFKIKCLGRGESEVNGVKNQNFFLVVESKEIMIFRKKVQQEFIKNGGNKNDFKPENYYPHITIGFTQKDIHIEDGLKKDSGRCVADVLMAKT